MISRIVYGLIIIVVLFYAASIESIEKPNFQEEEVERDLYDYDITETEYELKRPKTTHHPTTDNFSQSDGAKPPWW